MKDVNLETIADTLSWYKITELNGFNHTGAKQTLLRKQKRAYKSSWSRRENQKSFTLTIPQNLATLVKTYPGIIVRQHLTVQRKMVLLKERYAELGSSAVLLQAGLDEKWWADSMACCCYLRNIQDLLSDGKTPYEQRFGEPFKGSIVPFCSMVDYFCQRLVETPPIR